MASISSMKTIVGAFRCASRGTSQRDGPDQEAWHKVQAAGATRHRVIAWHLFFGDAKELAH